MAEHGWMPKDLARAAKVSEMTVSRFLRKDRQTAKTAKKLADALGYSPRRYVIQPRRRQKRSEQVRDAVAS
jgi:DNA-binding LacI/PurR family transcriptional regulator